MRLAAYLDRVGITGALRADAAALARLHLAHRETFLFENLTIQTGGSISLALDDLERKFLDERRGGYCFEHNSLFAAVLREVGFEPVTLLGRVRRGPRERWCRTHMVLKVPTALGAGVLGAQGGAEVLGAEVLSARGGARGVLGCSVQSAGSPTSASADSGCSSRSSCATARARCRADSSTACAARIASGCSRCAMPTARRWTCTSSPTIRRHRGTSRSPTTSPRRIRNRSFGAA